jgi:membrane-bound metal-dependent hydrolase YbcI (DUF457 family)
MPSPLAHLTAGYVLYRLGRAHQPNPALGRLGPVPGLLAVTAGVSLLPDLDSIVGVLAGDFGRFHNNLTHSLLVGAAVALLLAVALRAVRGNGFGFWFAIVLAAYELHVLMDWTTYGRGVMVWWPLTAERFQAPVFVFYGLHWSQGWLSTRHLWTLTTELLFAAVTLLALRTFTRRRAPTTR